ncbi:MAG: hypothetical protein V7L14_18810 [Nostoc sp.]
MNNVMSPEEVGCFPLLVADSQKSEISTAPKHPGSSPVFLL